MSQWNERVFAAKKEWHKEQAKLPIKEKMRQLLELQKHDLPLLAKQRELKWWEKPWNIEP
jgi:tRNA(Ile)-lysidine synthase TilS/MesJ